MLTTKTHLPSFSPPFLPDEIIYEVMQDPRIAALRQQTATPTKRRSSDLVRE